MYLLEIRHNNYVCTESIKTAHHIANKVSPLFSPREDYDVAVKRGAQGGIWAVRKVVGELKRSRVLSEGSSDGCYNEMAVLSVNWRERVGEEREEYSNSSPMR